MIINRKQDGEWQDIDICPICNKHKLERLEKYCGHCAREFQLSAVPFIYMKDGKPTGEVIFVAKDMLVNASIDTDKLLPKSRRASICEKFLQFDGILVDRRFGLDAVLSLLSPFYIRDKLSKMIE